MITVTTIRELLIKRVKEKEDPKITYTHLGDEVGLQARSKTLRDLLSGLLRQNYNNKEPLLSCLVVRDDTKLPGQGFWIAICDVLTAGERKGFDIEKEWKKIKDFYGDDN